MLRKLFGSTMVVSMIGSAIIGGAAAWTNSTAASSQTAHVGTVSVALANAASTNLKLYPTGQWISVLQGQVQNNTPPDPGVNVGIIGGSASGYDTNCVSNAQVAVTDAGSIGPNGAVGGGWTVQMAMPTNAPKACEGAALSYSLVIDVQTQ